MADFVTYSAAITATNNSTAVTGSGTAFVTDGVRAGDIAYFIESSGPVGYPIASIESATGFTLETAYKGSTGGSKTVLVMRRFDEERASDTYRLLNSYVQSLEDTISVSQAGIQYAYSSSTSMTDPVDGTFRFNNATPASVTAIAISDNCGEVGNPDASGFINSWDDSSAVSKGILYIKKAGEPQTFMVFTITGLADNTGWSQLAVSYVTGNGAIVDGDDVRFEFYRNGNDGFESGTRLTYSTTTTDSDPGSGIFRFNNSTFASITFIYIDNVDANGNTITSLLDLFDDSTTTAARGIVRLQKTGDPSVYRDFTVTGAVVDGTGYRKIPVTPIVSSGTWTNADPFTLTFFRTGNAGADGYQAGYRYTYSSTTTDSDPGAGAMRLNNATASSATFAYFDNTDLSGGTVTTWLDGLDDSTQSNHKGYLRIQKASDPTIYVEYVVTGAIVDGTGYRKVPISNIASNGVLANSDAVVVTFSRTGNAGSDGTNGTQPGYRLTFSTTITDSDPGTGIFRFNNASFGVVNLIFIDNTDATGADITTFLDGLDDSSSVIKGRLRFEVIGTPTIYRELQVTGSVVDGSGYRKVTVTPIATSGTLSDGASVAMTFFRSGDAGSASVANGTYGDIEVTNGGATWSIRAGTVETTDLVDTDLQDLASKWTAASASAPASLDFAEDADNGSNRIRLSAPSNIAADGTVTLPSVAGTIIGTGAETLSAANQHQARKNIGAALKGHIFGLTLSNNGTDATNDIDIAAGECASTETDPVLMILASTLTKRLDAAWAVGTGNGGRDTGSIADGTWHVWLIQRSDTGVVDALFSTSATSPTMPTNYDRKRRIGSIMRASATIRPFTQRGEHFLWSEGIVDVNTTNPGTAQVNYTLSVPSGIVAFAELSVRMVQATASEILFGIGTPGKTVSPLMINGCESIGSTQYRASAYFSGIETNTSSQVAADFWFSDANTTLNIITIGWVDNRGRFS